MDPTLVDAEEDTDDCLATIAKHCKIKNGGWGGKAKGQEVCSQISKQSSAWGYQPGEC